MTRISKEWLRRSIEAEPDDAEVEAGSPMLKSCPTCEGGGQVQIQVTVPRCCGRAEHECGGRGCTGPEPDVDVDVDGCPDCGGSGLIPARPEQESK